MRRARDFPVHHSGLLLASLLAASLLAGCAKKQTAEAAPPPAPAPAADGRHPLTGTVVTINKDRGTLLVEHDDVPGVMSHMTMEFKVAPGDLAVAREGMRIRARLYEAPDGFHLEQVWPVDATTQRVVDDAANALRQDTVTRGRGAFREIGENLPDFALYDQNGAVVQASRFRGKQVVMNFIYSRCPDPNMCPASTMKMMQIQTLAREAGVKNLELVSITLDPEFDTPGILRDYADARGIDTSNFSFLTGPERAIKDMLTQLGVLVLADGPLIKHTLSTVLVNESGKIIYRVEGSQWQAADFASRLRKPEKAGGS